MSAFKGTPGPWVMERERALRAELLAALQVAELALRERGLRACGEYKQIEAAIAKATGDQP